MNIHQVSDYIILKLDEGNVPLNNLKLQKLVYYAQAWHLAMNDGKPLFNGKFQAWIHGPVNRDLYARFVENKSLYSPIETTDISKGFNPEEIPVEARNHIDMVLESYAPFSGSQLEAMTHEETPWIEARDGYHPAQRCEVLLNEETMMSYYESRLKNQN